MRPLFAILAMLASGGPADDWEEVRPEGAGFSVKMPPGAVVTRQGEGDEAAVAVIVRSTLGRAGYVVTRTESAGGGSKAVLDGTRDLLVKSSKGRLLGEKKVALGRVPGRELRAEVPMDDDPKGGLLRCRIYLSGRRVYQVMVVCPRDAGADPEVDAFFRSFRLDPER